MSEPGLLRLPDVPLLAGLAHLWLALLARSMLSHESDYQGGGAAQECLAAILGHSSSHATFCPERWDPVPLGCCTLSAMAAQCQLVVGASAQIRTSQAVEARDQAASRRSLARAVHLHPTVDAIGLQARAALAQVEHDVHTQEPLKIAHATLGDPRGLLCWSLLPRLSKSLKRCTVECVSRNKADLVRTGA